MENKDITRSEIKKMETIEERVKALEELRLPTFLFMILTCIALSSIILIILK